MRTIICWVVLALIWAGLAGKAAAQQIQIRNYGVGYRVFEVEEVGGNPLSIAPLLKQPVHYQDFLSRVQYNGFSGGAAIQRLHTYYLTAELSRPGTTSYFWRKHTIQVGLLASNQLVKDGMMLRNLQVEGSDDRFTIYEERYSLVQKQRFAGVALGLNRRFRLANRLQLLTGLQVQGSIAALHLYQQQWDSAVTVVQNQEIVRRELKTSRLPTLQGRHYFQWQAMLPLGLEAELISTQVFVRLEGDLGVVGSRFRSKDFASREALGVGLWLIYQPKRL